MIFGWFGLSNSEGEGGKKGHRGNKILEKTDWEYLPNSFMSLSVVFLNPCKTSENSKGEKAT
jgi:hypothetical protein